MFLKFLIGIILKYRLKNCFKILQILASLTFIVTSVLSLKLYYYKQVDFSKGTVQCSSTFKNYESIEPDFHIINSVKSLEDKIWAQNISEGEWSHPQCVGYQRVAIIIPCRDREEQLKILINHLHPFLQRQLRSYGIFVITQIPGRIFNKAALFNVGFKEALSRKFSCFVFHDVDMLPLDLANVYKCSDNPVHLSVATDKYLYKLPYEDLLGGVVAMNESQFLSINGYSNLYFGWGSEDDDLSARVQAEGYKIMRNPTQISRYMMIKHSRDKGNPRNENMNILYKYAKARYKEEGLNSLQYVFVSNKSDSKLYRRITVQFSEGKIMKKWKKLYNLQR